MSNIKSEIIIVDYDCSADEITAIMGAKPSKVIMKGDIKREDPQGWRPPILYERNAWVLTSEMPEGLDLEEYVNISVSWAYRYKGVIGQIAKKYPVELSIYGFLGENQCRPAMHFSRHTNAKLAKLSIELDIDIYPAEESFLDSNEKIEALVDRLVKLKVHNMDKVELRNFVQTLAAFESESPLVADVIGDLFWDELNRQDIEERIDALRQSLVRILNLTSKTQILNSKVKS